MKVPHIAGVIAGCILAGSPLLVAQSAGSSSHPSSAQSANPFPQAQSEAAAKAAQQNGSKAPSSGQSPAASAGSQSAPAPSKSKSKQSSPAEDNPFPEAQSQAAARRDSRANTQTQAAPQPGGSSGGGYSSSSQDLPPADVGQGELRPNGKEKEDTYTMDKDPKMRIKNDLNVADFYFKNGNYRGAYLRYQDTLKYDPVNETALYGSALAMCKQNLTQDALHSFHDYLQLYPEGKYTKKAASIVAHPARCMHNR